MPTRHEQRLANRVSSALNRQHGVTVQLKRGSVLSAEMTARRSDKEHSALGGEYGLEIKILMREYDLVAADVLLGGVVAEPREGDLIVEGDNAYEVQAPDDNRPAVVPIRGGLGYRVHTRLLAGFDVKKVQS